MKKVITLFIVCFFLITSVPKSNAADDITNHLFENEMRVLISMGILQGDGTGIYRPDDSITRAEFAALIVRALELEPVVSAEFSVAASSEQLYKDVHPDVWYYSPIDTATKMGIVKGYPDGIFKPEALISRQEMAAMTYRAIDSKGILSSPANITFTDKSSIYVDFLDPIQRLVSLEIMEGTDDHTFLPLDKATRGQTAAVISRMLTRIESSVASADEYKIVEFNPDGSTKTVKRFAEFSSAKSNVASNQVIMQGNSIVYIKSGMAVSNSVVKIYDDTNFVGSGRTYVNAGTEFTYLDADKDWVKISIGNKVGYVDPENVNLIPTSLIVDQSSYKRVGDELYHTIYNPIAKTSSSILLGTAPSFMVEEQKYYSEDGVTYTDVNGNIVGEATIYFNRLDLKTQTQYSAEDLDEYLIKFYPETYAKKLAQYLIDEKGYSIEEAEVMANQSPLAGLGSYFKEMEATYEVNALYLMAHAIHESAWGTSSIAQTKYNLYGINATDTNPEGNADTYASFEDSIKRAAEFVTNAYLSPSNWRYNGSFLGNKGAGMNVKYASDPYWGEKIAGHMYRADKYLVGLDTK